MGKISLLVVYIGISFVESDKLYALCNMEDFSGFLLYFKWGGIIFLIVTLVPFIKGATEIFSNIIFDWDFD